MLRVCCNYTGEVQSVDPLFSPFSLLSHIQTVRIQQEVVHADDQNAVIGVPGSGGVFDNDNLLKGIVDAEQRIGFLLHFGFVWNGESGLDIVALCALITYEIHFQLLLLTIAGAIVFAGNYQADIHIEISCNQLIEQNIFHGVIFFDLTEVDPGITQAHIAEIILLRGINVLFAFDVIAGCPGDDKSITQIVQITLDGVDTIS